MKRLISCLMVIAMLASLCAVSAFAEKNGGQTNMEVTVPRFSEKPTFDGVISEEEWGSVTVTVVTEGAATLVDDDAIGENKALGLKNYFYCWYDENAECDSLAYDMWLRWDDDYLYVAAVVNDPNPFSAAHSGEEVWSNDMIEIFVDDQGPSATMKREDPDFNYKTDSFNGSRWKKPWSNDSRIFKGIMSLVKGTEDTFWRQGPNYGDGWDLERDGALVGISYVEHDDYTCTIQYEGAIPWAVIDTDGTGAPAVGDAYGMGVGVACTDESDLIAWLQWGQGVLSANEEGQPKPTRGGSQAIVFSGDTVTPKDGYDVNTEPPVTTTETEEIVVPPPAVITTEEEEIVVPPPAITITEEEVTEPVFGTVADTLDDESVEKDTAVSVNTAETNEDEDEDDEKDEDKDDDKKDDGDTSSSTSMVFTVILVVAIVIGVGIAVSIVLVVVSKNKK